MWTKEWDSLKYDYSGVNHRVADNERFKREAEINNQRVMLLANTKFKVGDTVRLKYPEKIVEITRVLPAGYITIPAGHSYWGHGIIGPVRCDKNLYQYKIVGHEETSIGQTTEDSLEFI